MDFFIVPIFVLFLITDVLASRDCIKPYILGGRTNIRARGQIARYMCRRPYRMFGAPVSTCVNGVWIPEPPKCGIDCPVTHVKQELNYTGRRLLTESICMRGYEALSYVIAHCDGSLSDKSYPICLAEACAETYKFCSSNDCNVFAARNLNELYVSCAPGYSSVGTDKIVCESASHQNPFYKCQASPLQFSCDFEKVFDPFCGWGQPKTESRREGAFVWFRRWRSDRIDALPDSDHTYEVQARGSIYLYLPTHVLKMGDSARLYSPTYNLSANTSHCFMFWYHMKSRLVGELNVYVNDIVVWTMAGAQGDVWNEAFVKLPSGNVTIIVEATRGYSPDGFIAIDDFLVTNALEEGDHECFVDDTAKIEEPDVGEESTSSDETTDADDSSQETTLHSVEITTQNGNSDLHTASLVHVFDSVSAKTTTQEVSASAKTTTQGIPVSENITTQNPLHHANSSQQDSVIASSSSQTSVTPQSPKSESSTSKTTPSTASTELKEISPSTTTARFVHETPSSSVKNSFSTSAEIPSSTENIAHLVTNGSKVESTKPLPDTVEGIHRNVHESENASHSSVAPTTTGKANISVSQETENHSEDHGSNVGEHESNKAETVNNGAEHGSSSPETKNSNTEHEIHGTETGNSDTEHGGNAETENKSVKSENSPVEENNIAGADTNSESPDETIALEPVSETSHRSTENSDKESNHDYSGFNAGSQFHVDSKTPKSDIAAFTFKFQDDNFENGIDTVDVNPHPDEHSNFDEYSCEPAGHNCGDNSGGVRNLDEVEKETSSNIANEDIRKNFVMAEENEEHQGPMEVHSDGHSDFQGTATNTTQFNSTLHTLIVSATGIALLLMIVLVVAVFRVIRKQMKKQQRWREGLDDRLSINLQLSNSKEILNFSLLRPDEA